MADPENALVPFGQFERLHFARFVILEAPTADDIAVYGLPPAQWPTSLAFLGDCDGPADSFLADLVDRAGAGLRQVFAYCQDFSPESDLLDWMKRHEQPSAASYVNWIGRTVRADPRGAGAPSRAGRSSAERRGPGIGRRAPGRTARPAGRLRATPSSRPAA